LIHMCDAISYVFKETWIHNAWISRAASNLYILLVLRLMLIIGAQTTTKCGQPSTWNYNNHYYYYYDM